MTTSYHISRVRDHSLFMSGGGLARIKGRESRQFQDSSRGVMRKLAYKRGGAGVCPVIQFQKPRKVKANRKAKKRKEERLRKT